jgi:restriction modification system DNA specificity subunit
MNDKIKLKDACKILNGFAFKSGKYVDSGIRIIRIANVQKGYVEDERPVFYPNSEESSIRDYMLEEDDLLLSLTGNVGRVALLDKRWLPAALNQRVACLRIKDDRIIKDYLYFALLSDKFENDCTESSKGIAQKNMSTEWLKDYEIPLPSGQKQREIISSLKQLSMIIKNKTEQIQQLDDLIKARFVEMFGGEQCAILQDLSDRITDGSHLPPKGVEKSDYLMLSSQNIFDEINRDGARFLSKEDFENENRRTDIKDGDVLVTIVGTIGRTHIVRSGEKYVFQRSVGVIKPKSGRLNGIYLASYLQTCRAKAFLTSRAHGSSQKGIYLQDLKKLPVPLVPMALQNQFAAFVAQVDKSKFAAKQRTCDVQLLRSFD